MEKKTNPAKGHKSKDEVERAVQWLKERGVNPHLRKEDVTEKNVFGIMESKRAAFEHSTGKVTIPYFGTIHNILYEMAPYKGTIEHELFHRGDYLEKFWGKGRLRRDLYMKWDAKMELMQEVNRHNNYLDMGHPLHQAIKEIGSKGYSAADSIFKLWRKDPTTFKKMLTIATALRVAEVNDILLDKTTIQKAKEKVINYLKMTPVKASKKKQYFDVLSEIPAHMIKEYRCGKSPEEGLRIAKEKITGENYFRGTELEDVARKAADNYLHLAHTLREKGLDDEQIVRAILALHKNIYTPEDAEMFVQNKRMLGNAAEAVKARGFKAEEIQRAIAAQALVKMDENVKAIEKEKTRKVDR